MENRYVILFSILKWLYFNLKFQWARVCYRINYSLNSSFELLTVDMDSNCEASDIYIETISAPTMDDLETKALDVYSINSNVK